LPKGVRVHEVALKKDAELRGAFKPDLLHGVGIVEAEVVVKPSPTWKQELYRPLVQPNGKSMTVRFIPYFAWANRGASEMTVWLPID
jgi:uncharacterized protein